MCPESIATALWVRTAVLAVPLSVMAPPLNVSLFAAIAMPFRARSFSATVREHTIVVVFVAAAQFAVFGAPAKSSSSCGAPVMSTASSKVTVAATLSPMP